MDLKKELVGKKVVVTGAAGFIGSHLCETLIEYGAEVIGVDNLSNGDINNLSKIIKNPKFKFCIGDVCDTSFMIEITRGAEIIFHEGAFISVTQSLLTPELCHNVNVTGTVNVLNAARINDVKSVVFASSAAVYGNTEVLPITESIYPAPISPYGVSKWAAESYVVMYHKAYGLKTTALRYFNVYGPRQRNNQYAGVISIFAKRMIEENKNPVIYGDGTQTRDFIYVLDVVKANILSAVHQDSGGKFYNVATGKSIDLNSLTKLMVKIVGNPNIKIEYAEARKGDILHSQADISKIIRDIGFVADYTIEQGLTNYIHFFKSLVKK